MFTSKKQTINIQFLAKSHFKFYVIWKWIIIKMYCNYLFFTCFKITRIYQQSATTNLSSDCSAITKTSCHCQKEKQLHFVWFQVLGLNLSVLHRGYTNPYDIRQSPALYLVKFLLLIIRIKRRILFGLIWFILDQESYLCKSKWHYDNGQLKMLNLIIKQQLIFSRIWIFAMTQFQIMSLTMIQNFLSLYTIVKQQILNLRPLRFPV